MRFWPFFHNFGEKNEDMFLEACEYLHFVPDIFSVNFALKIINGLIGHFFSSCATPSGIFFWLLKIFYDFWVRLFFMRHTIMNLFINN